MCTLLGSHFLSVKMEFSVLFFFHQVVCFEVSHPDTNPAGQQLTLVNFCRGKLSEAQSAR